MHSLLVISCFLQLRVPLNSVVLGLQMVLDGDGDDDDEGDNCESNDDERGCNEARNLRRRRKEHDGSRHSTGDLTSSEAHLLEDAAAAVIAPPPPSSAGNSSDSNSSTGGKAQLRVDTELPNKRSDTNHKRSGTTLASKRSTGSGVGRYAKSVSRIQLARNGSGRGQRGVGDKGSPHYTPKLTVDLETVKLMKSASDTMMVRSSYSVCAQMLKETHSVVVTDDVPACLTICASLGIINFITIAGGHLRLARLQPSGKRCLQRHTASCQPARHASASSCADAALWRGDAGAAHAGLSRHTDYLYNRGQRYKRGAMSPLP